MMTLDQQSELRHSLRGCMNALKLGVSVLDGEMSDEETVEFLTYLEQAAGKMEGLMDRWVEEFGTEAG